MHGTWPRRRRAPTRTSPLELERSAARAQARGGLAAAAAFLQRAVALTGDPARRADRALAAAEASLGAGTLRRGAWRCWRRRRSAPLDELQRARLDLLRAEAAFSESRGSDAPALLLRAAKTLEPLDPQLARETYLDAWSSALFAGRLASGVGLHEVSREAARRRRAAPSAAPVRSAAATGLRSPFTDGRSAAAPVLEAGGDRLSRASDVSVEEAPALGLARDRGRRDGVGLRDLLAVATRGVELARDAGALDRAAR